MRIQVVLTEVYLSNACRALSRPHPALLEAAEGHGDIVLAILVDMHRADTQRPGYLTASAVSTVSSARVAAAISRSRLRVCRATQML